MTGEKKIKVWWDEKNGIIRNKTWGDFGKEDAQRLSSALLKLIESRPGQVLILNDLTEAGNASYEARKIFADMFKNERIKRRAFVGMKTLTKVIVSFIMNFSSSKNVKFFDTEEAALSWLKEEDLHDRQGNI